jgi:DNA-binding phage protein
MKSGLGRENHYRIFSAKMNPKVETVIKALVALDVHLMAKPSTG